MIKKVKTKKLKWRKEGLKLKAFYRMELESM
jgi:hypothetical protein